MLKIKVSLWTATLACMFSPAILQAALVKSFDTHTHFELNVDPGTLYSVKKIEVGGKITGLRIIVTTFLETTESANILSSLNDTRTEKFNVTLNEQAKTTTYDIFFKSEAAKRGIEYYDYRLKDNSGIVLDYWTKGLENRKVALEEPKKNIAVKKLNHFGSLKKISFQNQSKHESLFAKSCNVPLNYDVDGEIAYNIYHKNFAYEKYFKMKRPDEGYEYPNLKGEVSEQDQDEVMHYRFAFKLSEQKKYALSLRTIDLFQKKYPKSKLNTELSFLKIGLFVELAKELGTAYYRKEAIDLLSKIYLEDPSSEKGRLAQMYLIQDTFEKNQEKVPYAILQAALQGAENEKLTNNPFLKQLFRMAAAESLQSLGEFERAETNYQQIVDSGGDLSSEAAFRLGEVFLARKLYDQAIYQFQTAIKKYPEEATRFPSAWFNLAETFHKIKNYSESTKVYKEYLKLFPNEKNAWAAHFRIAEHFHLAMKNRNPESMSQLTGEYDAVINRIPYSPGAFFANLRNADCMPSSESNKSKYRKDYYLKFFNEVDFSLLADPLLNLEELKVVTDLISVKYHVKNADYANALEKTEIYNPSLLLRMKYGPVFKAAFEKAAVSDIEENVKNGRFSEAIASLDEYGSYVPESKRDFRFQLTLAQAYFGDKKYDSARQILKKIENESVFQRASNSEKSDFYLLTAKVSFAEKNYAKTVSSLQQIDEKPDNAVEKYDLLSRASFEKSDFRETIQYASTLLGKTTSDRNKSFEVSMLKLEAMIRIESPEKVSDFANEIFMKYGTLTQFADKQIRLSEIRAQSLYDTGQFKEVLSALDFVLKNKPEHPRLKEFEFMRAKSMASIGLDAEAREGFRKLAQTAGDDVWKKSAQSELDQMDWESSIKKQVNQKKDRRSLQ